MAKERRLLTIVIDKCGECPDNEYLHDGDKPFMEQDIFLCLKMDPQRAIPTHLYSIPEWCPLPKPEDT